MVKSVMQRPATASEIVEIMGRLDDAVIAAILKTEATRDEVLEAYAWLSADDYLHRERHRTIHGRTAAVYRILEAELPPPGAER